MKDSDMDRMRSSVAITPNESTTRTLAEVRERLARFEPLLVRLEPGDATRYEMLLSPFFPDGGRRTNPSLCITRMISGAPVGTVVVHSYQYDTTEYTLRTIGLELGNGNSWSARLFTWWFDQLLNHTGD